MARSSLEKCFVDLTVWVKRGLYQEFQKAFDQVSDKIRALSYITYLLYIIYVYGWRIS